MTIMPCGKSRSRRSLRSSWARNPSLAISRRPRSRGNRRMTAVSPCWVGMMATRTSRLSPAASSRAAPSWGSRLSAMLSPARILMREINAWGSACAGAGTGLSSPSTRMRTVSPLRIGSMWMSLARSSTAFSRRSLTARTTGAPLARSRRLSTLSSTAPEAKTEDDAEGPSSSDPRRSNSAAPISSKEAIETATGPPSTISAPLCAATSVGSATARPKRPPPSVVGKDHGFTQEAPGKTLNKGRRSQEFRQCHSRALVIRGDLVGEFAGGKIARFPNRSN